MATLQYDGYGKIVINGQELVDDKSKPGALALAPKSDDFEAVLTIPVTFELGIGPKARIVASQIRAAQHDTRKGGGAEAERLYQLACETFIDLPIDKLNQVLDDHPDFAFHAGVVLLARYEMAKKKPKSS
jgi:hypothetical protein